ncbi:MAG: WD40/YVTN/BNR-like repeat-containing protein [Nitrososphaerota archaeon]
MRDTESPESPLLPPPNDHGHDDANDDAPKVSPLRPTARLRGFSMRRLLNGASVAVAVVALLALAVHWLPDVLPRPLTPAELQRIHARQTYDTLHPPAPGTGWKAIGPDWATDISFTADGALGYVCGVNPPIPLVHVGVYDVHQQTWTELPAPPATSVDACRISVSPTDPADVVLISYGQDSSNNPLPSPAYRSLDGGATWSPLHLSPSQIIADIAWTNHSTLFLAAENVPAQGSTTPPAYSLLTSRGYGSLTEISARQLVGHSDQFSTISLISSGTWLYATLDEKACASNCGSHFAETSDDGASWTEFSATYQGGLVYPAAAQPGSSTLIGTVFFPDSSTLSLVRMASDGPQLQSLPALPVNPATGGASVFMLPDGSIYAFCFGNANVVYALHNEAREWRAVAALPHGAPLTVQYDAAGHAVALWGQSHPWDNGTLASGLEYYPIRGTP